MATAMRKLAVVTGASSGIGLELAKIAAKEAYDLIVVADEDEINYAADELRRSAVNVEAIRADLATSEGVTALIESIKGHSSQIELLMANAGAGLGHGFLDQDLDRIRHIINTNITGTMQLIHAVGNIMRDQGSGRILITGSIAGFMPGAFQAVYNGTKAYLNSFSFALRNELKDSGVTVTCLMPGATDTKEQGDGGGCQRDPSRDACRAAPEDGGTRLGQALEPRTLELVGVKLDQQTEAAIIELLGRLLGAQPFALAFLALLVVGL